MYNEQVLWITHLRETLHCGTLLIMWYTKQTIIHTTIVCFLDVKVKSLKSLTKNYRIPRLHLTIQLFNYSDDVIWICRDMMWCHDVMSCDMLWRDVMWFVMKWCHVICCDILWYSNFIVMLHVLTLRPEIHVVSISGLLPNSYCHCSHICYWILTTRPLLNSYWHWRLEFTYKDMK